MKKLITLFLVYIFSSAIVAQTTTDDYYVSSAKPKLLSKDRVNVSLTAGTSVSFMSGTKTTGFTTFLAPKINYQLSNKFRLNLGLMHYTASPNTAMLFNRNEGIANTGTNTLSGNLIFVGGDYLLNKRVTLSGAVMMDANGLSSKANNYKAASFGIDYKLSEHSSIGIQATIEQGNPNYFYNSSRNSFDYQPFVNSPNSFLGGLGAGAAQWGVESLNGLVH